MVARRGTRTELQAVPGRFWLVGLALFCLVGLADSIYLSALHWAVHNQPGHVSFCAVSEEVNCDTVALSPASVLAGVPVSVWGILFYSGVLILSGLAWWARKPPWPWALAGLLFGLAAGLTVYLVLVSRLIIQSFCLMCLVLYAVNLASALACILAGRRVGLPPASQASLALLGMAAGAGIFLIVSPEALDPHWVLLGAFGGGGLLGAAGLNLRGAAARWRMWGRALRSDLGQLFARPVLGVGLVGTTLAAGVACLIFVPRLYPDPPAAIAGGLEGLESGTTAEGHPWIGARHPDVTLYEYSDYECPFCRKAHEIVRQLVREYPDWLRLVHVHMPLDQSCNPRISRPFHRHSCDAALGSVCAAEQGAFWKMNDRLFQRRGGLDAGGLTVLAGELGLNQEAFRACMKSSRARWLLDDDLKESQRLGLRPATPTFRLEDQVLMGVHGIMDPAWWRTTVKKLRQQIRQARAAGEPDEVEGTPGRGGPDGGQAGPGG